MRKLVLIDFSWLYNKYYYVALQNVSLNIEQSSKGAEGLKEVLEQMLFQFLGHVEKSYPKVYLVLDSELSSAKNKEIFEGYKGNRDKEAKKEVYRFISEIIKDLAHKLNPKVFYFVREKFHEADELLAYLAKKFYEKFEIIIFSGDKDLLQLTSFPNVFISDKFEKGKFIIKT